MTPVLLLRIVVLLVLAVGLFCAGVIVGYLWRRAKPEIRVTYAGGTPFRSMTFESPNGDGGAFAQDLARLLIRDDMVTLPSVRLEHECGPL